MNRPTALKTESCTDALSSVAPQGPPMLTAWAGLDYKQRPQIIKTDLLGSTNFAFNLFDKAIKPVQMQSAA